MNKQFEPKTFTIPDLKGISAKSIAEHIKLYNGYVKNANLIIDKVKELSTDEEANSYTLGELQRRFGFEFDGMRNHEYYFAHLAEGHTDITPNGSLYKAIEAEWGDFDTWLSRFKHMAATRGVGWAVLYYDKESKRLLNTWVDEQHLGHLTGLSPILMLDMWEHSYVADYEPSGKKTYVEDFFANLSWKNVEENFSKASTL